MQMNTYAALKGPAVTASSAGKLRARKAPATLDDTDQTRVAENRAFVLEHMPELAPLIRELYDAGLIDGWRSVAECELITDSKCND